MIEENHLTKRYGKTVAVDQPVPLAQRPRAFTWARIVALVVIGVLLFGLTYIGSRTRRRSGLGPAGGARRPADHAPVHLRDRAGCDARGLRHVGRAGEPSELEVAPDRAAGDPDPGSLIPPAWRQSSISTAARA